MRNRCSPDHFEQGSGEEPISLPEQLGIWLIFLLEFYLLYGLGDYVASVRGALVIEASRLEQGLPFIPVFSIAYVSLYPMMWLSVLIVRTSRETWEMFAILSKVLIIAALCFVTLPTTVPASQYDGTGILASVYAFADALNLRANAVPSLHVAFAFTLRDIYARYCSRLATNLFTAWAVLIALSTLFLHQHRLIDVWAGMLLAYLAGRMCRAPLPQCGRPVSLSAAGAS